jgi:hypothetical protein
MRRLLTLAPVLLTLGCFGAKDSALFTDMTGGGGSTATLGGSANAHSGTDSGSAAGNHSLAGSASSGGTLSGGTGGTAAVAGSAGTNLGGGGGEHVVVPVIEDCSMVENAVVSELDGHCYRVNYQNLTFAQARDACQAAGGHLVSIGSEDENEFAAKLHDGEHWIGATDGRGDMVAGVGPYLWVNDEPWTYSAWEDGQPNAYETDCPGDSNEESDCFEHCAFQTDEADWNDRSCWHTIVSICEWDVEKPDEPDPGAAGAAGASGAAGAPDSH